MVLDNFSGDLLEWTDWTDQFLATINESGATDSVKKKHLETLVTGRMEAASKGMRFSGYMYHVLWQTLDCAFGRPELIVNAQRTKLHAYPFVKPQDQVEIVE